MKQVCLLASFVHMPMTFTILSNVDHVTWEWVSCTECYARIFYKILNCKIQMKIHKNKNEEKQTNRKKD